MALPSRNLSHHCSSDNTSQGDGREASAADLPDTCILRITGAWPRRAATTRPTTEFLSLRPTARAHVFLCACRTSRQRAVALAWRCRPINFARACARGFVSRSYSLGRRFTARGSQRSGRFPTRCFTTSWKTSAANYSRRSGVAHRSAARNSFRVCTVAVKLICRGLMPLASAACAITFRVRL